MLWISNGQLEDPANTVIAHAMVTFELDGFGNWNVVCETSYTFDPISALVSIRKEWVSKDDILSFGRHPFRWFCRVAGDGCKYGTKDTRWPVPSLVDFDGRGSALDNFNYAS